MRSRFGGDWRHVSYFFAGSANQNKHKILFSMRKSSIYLSLILRSNRFTQPFIAITVHDLSPRFIPASRVSSLYCVLVRCVLCCDACEEEKPLDRFHCQRVQNTEGLVI